MTFTTRSLVAAIATLSSIGYANAAGLDRSTQPSWGFTQDGTFAYIEHVTIDPSIEGKDTSGNKVPDMATDYQFLNFGAKADLNDTVTLGAFFDQPWGADVQFEGDNNFVQTLNGDQTVALLTQGAIPNLATGAGALTQLTQGINAIQQKLADPNLSAPERQALLTQLNGDGTATNPGLIAKANSLGGAVNLANAANANYGEGTNVSISSQNFTGLVGIKLGDKKQFQVYGGPALQKLEGNVHLRGNAYNLASGYDLGIPNTTGLGWMAGVAYSKPEIALKAALTYRSEIDHDFDLIETYPAIGANRVANETTVTTPQSVNVDFQTGLNPTTLLTAKLRWVPWSDFAVTPKVYNEASKRVDPNGYNLVDYAEDGWTAEVGLGKKVNDKLALTGVVGWDSGAGNPASTLGPIDGNWNVGVGARYNLTPEWALSGGVKYLMFGDATGQLPDHKTNVGEFSDNDGMVYGVRLSYQKK